LICALVRIACVQILSSRDLPVILEAGVPSTAALDRLEAALAEVEAALDLKRMWIAERVYALEIMRNLVPGGRHLQSADGRPPPIAERWPKDSIQPTLRMFATGMLRSHARYVDAATEQWPEVLEAMRTADRQRQHNTMANLLSPAAVKVTVNFGRALATTRAARLCLMIERYRREKGTVPESIADLTAAAGRTLPLDPFTGTDLIYRKSDDEYRVYSVGDDLKDGGGERLNQSNGSCDWGLFVRIPGADQAD